jgi:hypothetical protein
MSTGSEFHLHAAEQEESTGDYRVLRITTYHYGEQTSTMDSSLWALNFHAGSAKNFQHYLK